MFVHSASWSATGSGAGASAATAGSASAAGCSEAVSLSGAWDNALSLTGLVELLLGETERPLVWFVAIGGEDA